MKSNNNITCATGGSGNTSIATATFTVLRKKEDQEHNKEGALTFPSESKKPQEEDKLFWQFW